MSALAGESARDLARRQREKAGRLSRSADLYERGAEGEEATAAVLTALPVDEWTVFHDLRWPGRRFANVDHVVIGPPGVFVIDTKNWTGRIEVRDQVLRQNGRGREAAVAGVAEAAIAVGELTQAIDPQSVHPVLCFVRDESLTGWARDVMICSTSNLVTMLTTRSAVLSAQHRQMLALELDATLRSAAASPVATAAPISRAAADRPRATRRGTRPAQRRRHRWPDLLKLVSALAIAAIFLLLPGTVTSVADLFGQWFGSNVVKSLQQSDANDGQCPTTRPVKGFTNRAGVRIHRTPGERRYDQAAAELCFDSVLTAEAAGYSAAK